MLRAAVIATLVAATASARADDRAEPAARAHRARVQRVAAGLLAGASAAVFAVGAAHAIGWLYDDHLAESQCLPRESCNADGARLQYRAGTLKLASEMLIATSGMGVAGAVVLWRGARIEVAAAPGPGALARLAVRW